MRNRANRAVALAAAMVAAGCTGTPIPQPPPENLDVDKIVFPETSPTSNQVGFSGAPGAAPPNSTIRVTNLDSSDPPVGISVDEQGAFEATILALPDDEIRFQVRTDDDRRLTPIDLLFSNGGFVSPARVDCFSVDLELDLGASTSGVATNGTLTVSNACASDAQVTATRFRTNDVAFSFTDMAPMTVGASGTVGLGVTFTPDAVGELEELLLISVQIDGVDARYPTTLFGRGE